LTVAGSGNDPGTSLYDYTSALRRKGRIRTHYPYLGRPGRHGVCQAIHSVEFRQAPVPKNRSSGSCISSGKPLWCPDLRPDHRAIHANFSRVSFACD